MNRKIARIVLLSAGIFWAFGFIVNKYVMNEGWDDSQLLFVRFFTATVFIFLFFGKRIFKANRKTLLTGLILGVFLFLGFYFQTKGLEITTASNNALITAGYIVFLPLIVYIFEKRIVKYRTLLAALITFVGIAIISVDFKNLSNLNLGDFYTFIGSIFWGIHIYLLSIYAKKEDPVVIMGFQLLVVSVFAFLVMMFTTGMPPVNFNNFDSIKVLIAAVTIGFFASFLAFTFQSIGQKHSNETEAAILISSESLFGPILAIIIFKDPFDFQVFMGMFLVLSGILLSEIDILQYIKNRRNKSKEIT